MLSSWCSEQGFKIGVVGTSSSAGDTSGVITGSWLGGSVRTACSMGRFGVGGRCVAGSDWILYISGRGSSGGGE